jgi:carotenoid cleavage dioxygenase-like enzyme
LLTSPSNATQQTDLQIYDVLPKDAIRAILNPTFVPASEAQVEDEAAMIGVVINGEAHAYSAVLLNSQEIVNDVVGGEKIATTW